MFLAKITYKIFPPTINKRQQRQIQMGGNLRNIFFLLFLQIRQNSSTNNTERT